MQKKKTGLDILINIFEFILVLIILLDCNSIYRQTVTELNPRGMAMLAGIVSSLVLVALFVLKDKDNIEVIKDHRYLFLVSVLFVLLFNALNVVNTSGAYFLEYFLIFMNVMVILYGIYRRNGESFRLMVLMEHVVLFLAVASTLLWFGSSVLELWGRGEDVFVDWGGEYYDANYLNLCIRRWIYASDVTKNLGIYVEPPMFGLFLGFGLYTELFLKKKSNPLIVAAFIAAIASNRAILAMMISLVALFFKFIELIQGKKYAKILIIFSFIAASVGVVVLFFYKKNTGQSSFAVHLDDFAAAFKCWLRYPILGCGYNTEAPIREYMSEFRLHNQGLSNSAAVVLAEGGIVLFTYYIIPFLLIMSAFFRKNRKLAYWGIGMLFMWVVVIFHTRLFIFFIMAFGYSMLEIKKKKEDCIQSTSDPVTSEKQKFRGLSLRVLDYDENISEDKKFFTTKLVNLPNGLIILMGTVLFFVSMWGMIFKEEFSSVNLFLSISLIVIELLVLAVNIKLKKPDKLKNNIIQLILWGLYICIGQPYRVMDHFLTTVGMRIQDSWWKSIILVVMLYLIGLLSDRMIELANQRQSTRTF